MTAKVRQQVRKRARNACEYCHLHEGHEDFHPFHLEHVVPRQHRGTNALDNLAWSCHHCNLHKGTNLSSFDPDTNEVVRLYHPRRDRWEEHFKMDGPRIIGLSPIGRTTVWLLQMNSEARVELRRLLIALGEL